MTPFNYSQATAVDVEPLRRPIGVWVYAPLVAIAGIFLWILLTSLGTPTLVSAAGLTRLDPPFEFPAFSLESHDGKPFVRETLTGRWSLLSIGFTSCPDICPNTLSVLANAVEEFDPSGRDVQVLFVSVDPERDSPQALGSYASHFGERVVGITGSHEELQKLTKPIGLYYAKQGDAPSDGSYSVEHSTTVIVIDPAGDAVGLIGIHERDEETVVAALTALRESSHWRFFSRSYSRS